jgi:CO/xanthine dehydrogenase Mo-binding subunit
MSVKLQEAVKRVDAPDKCGGYAQYIGDLEFEGMMYAKTLRSHRSRARIQGIVIPELPDGYFVVDKDDVPGVNRVKMLVYDQPFFAEDVVNYVGEPILLVVGPEKEKILEIISGIEVHYEDMDPILTIEEAEAGGKPPIFGDDNCFADYEYQKGEPDEAFDRAVKITEDEFRTGYQEHLYLEPQGVVGIYENGRVTVYGSIQCPYYVKQALVEGLGCCEDDVRVVQATTGGAFGGKEEYPSLIAGHVAFAAVKSCHPVQLIFDRTEDMEVTTKRHPSIIRFRTGLDESGNVMVMDVDIRLNGGAYSGLSSVVLQRSMFSATGVYHIPHVRVRGRVYATNTVPTGALRGFGSPQAFFAVEMHMLNIAQALDSDPVDFKKAHVLKKGDLTSTGGKLRDEVVLSEMIDMICADSDFMRKYEEYSVRDTLRGIGISLFFHGCGFTGKGEEIIQGRATLRKRNDGKAEILVSNVEMGQGAQTALKKIVSHTLGIPLEDVVYENPDTDRVPDSGPTVASRTVMIVGGLLAQAAEELKERWSEQVELEVSKVYRHPAYIQWDQETLQGDAYPVYSWGANVIEVEVDPITYEIEVTGIWTVYDVGVPIDEKGIQAQIEGGVVQGLGYASREAMDVVQGHVMQKTLTDYPVPTSMDFPEIESRLVLNPYEYGPYGAKCAGELPFIGAAPAFAAAVQHAIGIPVKRIPVTPEYLLGEIECGH